jgi:hypothetical protein
MQIEVMKEEIMEASQWEDIEWLTASAMTSEWNFPPLLGQ